NSAYENLYSLKNAAKDAQDVARTLETLDFDVTLITDADEASFWEQLEAFAARADAEDAESTLFYFSGHAFQLDGTNYLVPSDAALTGRDAIETETWRLDEIVGRLEDRNRQTLIFLDACRNNPMPEGRRGATQSGLAKLETGSGTFVAFATQPNNVTADGSGDNSPFTSALLDSMNTKGISISDMMIEVRNEVEDKTFGRQTPWDQSSLRAQFYFNPVVERSASLTEADYEMIASLPPETRNRLLAAMGKAGLRIEDAEIEDVQVAKVVAANPAFTIEDVEGDLVEQFATSREIPPAKPEDVDVAAASPYLTLIDVPDPELAARAASGIAHISLRTPRESSVPVVIGRPPGAPAEARRAKVAAVQNGATLRGNGGSAKASNSAAARRAASAEPGAVPNTALSSGTVIAGAGDPARTGAVDAGATGLQPNLASVLPPDPGALDSALLGDAGIVLASIGATRSVLPILPDRSRLPGEEITKEAAADLGITLPGDEPALAGRDLARAVQTELKRLGCYRMAIDGAFGKGSKLALVRYYGNRGIAPDSFDPSNALLRILRTEENVICEGTQIQNTRVAKAKKTITTQRKAKVTKAKAQAPRKTVKKTTKKKRTIQTTPKQTTTNSGRTTKRSIKRINTGVFR
ncbi:MAG: caspase family protein, partial [Pseudomonadota bacterium]